MKAKEPALNTTDLELPESAPPSDDDYMGPRQLAYFKKKLQDWRSTLLEENDATIAELRSELEALRRVVDDLRKASFSCTASADGP